MHGQAHSFALIMRDDGLESVEISALCSFTCCYLPGQRPALRACIALSPRCRDYFFPRSNASCFGEMLRLTTLTKSLCVLSVHYYYLLSLFAQAGNFFSGAVYSAQYIQRVANFLKKLIFQEIFGLFSFLFSSFLLFVALLWERRGSLYSLL